MKIPKLYIRGMKESKHLSYAEGKTIEDMLKDSLIDPETPIVIDGVWTGKKKDVKFVDWESEKDYGDRPEIELSPQEFNDIKGELLKAEKRAEEKGFAGHARNFWYVFKGVVRLEFKKDFENQSYYTVTVRDPSGYIRLQDLLEAYDRKRNKIEYAKKKDEEHLEKLASEQ